MIINFNQKLSLVKKLMKEKYKINKYSSDIEVMKNK